jgi:hypothetical protein
MESTSNLFMFNDQLIYGDTLVYWFCNPTYQFIQLHYACGETEIIRATTEEEYKDLCNKFNKMIGGIYE